MGYLEEHGVEKADIVMSVMYWINSLNESNYHGLSKFIGDEGSIEENEFLVKELTDFFEKFAFIPTTHCNQNIQCSIGFEHDLDGVHCYLVEDEIEKADYLVTETECGHEEYSPYTCNKCGQTFCYACCGKTNIDQGGKYEKDFMLCPKCEQDVFE